MRRPHPLLRKHKMSLTLRAITCPDSRHSTITSLLPYSPAHLMSTCLRLLATISRLRLYTTRNLASLCPLRQARDPRLQAMHPQEQVLSVDIHRRGPYLALRSQTLGLTTFRTRAMIAQHCRCRMKKDSPRKTSTSRLRVQSSMLGVQRVIVLLYLSARLLRAEARLLSLLQAHPMCIEAEAWPTDISRQDSQILSTAAIAMLRLRLGLRCCKWPKKTTDDGRAPVASRYASVVDTDRNAARGSRTSCLNPKPAIVTTMGVSI